MKRITFFILSIFCITACNNDVDMEKPEPPTQQIQLIMPAAKVSVYSTATVSECKIETMWVIAFQGGSTGPKLWVEKIDVSRITNNGQATQLVPQLLHKPDINDFIVCIANVDALTLPADTTGLTYANINTKFRLNTKHFYSGGEALPMYGEMIWGDINNGYTCVMTRAVAKVQVQLGTSVSDILPGFSSDDARYWIYNSGYTGHIQPAASLQGNSHTSSHNTSAFRLMQRDGSTEAEKNVYIHEYPSATKTGINNANITNNKTFDKDRQHIIIEYDGFYNRLDFFNHRDSTFFDTERNHHYIFTINKIRSHGYSSVADAQNNPGSNIEYTVKIIDDLNIINSNGQYAIVSNIPDTVYIPASTPGPHTNLSIGTARIQLPAEMSSVSGSNTILIPPSSITPASGTISTSISSLPYTNQEIRITTNGAFQKATINISVGNIYKNIVVEQL